MTTYTTSQARQQLFQLVDTTAEDHIPIYIIGKRNDAVLLSAADYAGLMETLHLTSIPGMVESILKADAEPLSKGSKKLKW
jgi:antitoxin YefM